jgi:hypothetical protein
MVQDLLGVDGQRVRKLSCKVERNLGGRPEEWIRYAADMRRRSSSAGTRIGALYGEEEDPGNALALGIVGASRG